MGHYAICRLASSNAEPDPSAQAAARELRDIAKRHAILGDVISADIGWSLLLWLLVLEDTGEDVTTAYLLQQADVGDDTGGRWLALLEQSDLLCFGDSDHKQRAYVAFTAAGREKIRAALEY